GAGAAGGRRGGDRLESGLLGGDRRDRAGLPGLVSRRQRRSLSIRGPAAGGRGGGRRPALRQATQHLQPLGILPPLPTLQLLGRRALAGKEVFLFARQPVAARIILPSGPIAADLALVHGALQRPRQRAGIRLTKILRPFVPDLPLRQPFTGVF